MNRPATVADLIAFKEDEVTLAESAERAVVGKEAHVAEGIAPDNQLVELEYVMRDTVRNTEVDVEQLADSTMTTTGTASLPSKNNQRPTDKTTK